MTATTAHVLRPVADALVFMTNTTVHPTLFPYLWGPTLHAARISLAYQANARKQPGYSKMPWATYIAGYLIMCWGGTLTAHFLCGLPPPQLYSFHPYINYGAVHLALTLLLSVFPQILTQAKIFDTALVPVDAFMRTNAVTGALSLLQHPRVAPELVTSTLFHLILGAAGSAGGGVAAGTFSLWSADWRLDTPVFLRGRGTMATLDLWGGSLVAAVYGTFSLHPAFAPVFVCLVEQGLVAKDLTLSTLGARAMGALTFMALFGLRVWHTHYRATHAPQTAPAKKKL
ncbi:hypothetical protein HDZ31DRAFT_46053 [Schizophyllum fasciatum]